MDKDLKPCPFCGSPAIEKRNGNITCGADIYKDPYCPLLFQDINVDRWNTRATDCPAVDFEADKPIYEMLEHAILCLEYAQKEATTKGYSVHCHEALLTLRRLASRNLIRTIPDDNIDINQFAVILTHLQKKEPAADWMLNVLQNIFKAYEEGK